MFGYKPKYYRPALESNDHPELDTSEKLAHKDIIYYQSMIGSLQWAVSLGCFDMNSIVMTLSTFRSAPRQGHQKRLQRIYVYIAKFGESAIRIQTQEPNYPNIVIKEYDWKKSVYGEVKKLLPKCQNHWESP